MQLEPSGKGVIVLLSVFEPAGLPLMYNLSVCELKVKTTLLHWCGETIVVEIKLSVDPGAEFTTTLIFVSVSLS